MPFLSVVAVGATDGGCRLPSLDAGLKFPVFLLNHTMRTTTTTMTAVSTTTSVTTTPATIPAVPPEESLGWSSSLGSLVIGVGVFVGGVELGLTIVEVALL